MAIIGGESLNPAENKKNNNMKYPIKWQPQTRQQKAKKVMLDFAEGSPRAKLVLVKVLRQPQQLFVLILCQYFHQKGQRIQVHSFTII